MEEDVVTDPREADVGSILGFGFAPFTGGTLSFIDGMGLKAFVARRAPCGQPRPPLRPAGEADRNGGQGPDVLRNLRREAEGRLNASLPRGS